MPKLYFYISLAGFADQATLADSRSELRIHTRITPHCDTVSTHEA